MKKFIVVELDEDIDFKDAQEVARDIKTGDIPRPVIQDKIQSPAQADGVGHIVESLGGWYGDR
jgi:hypothetical protein